MGHKNRDAREAAAATAASNMAAAQQTVQANRVNQVTPWGNITYNQSSPNQWEVTQTLTPELQNLLNQAQAVQGSSLGRLQDLINRGIPSTQVNANLNNLSGIDQTRLPGLMNWDTSNFTNLLGIDTSKLPQLPKWDTSNFAGLLSVNPDAAPAVAKLLGIDLNALPRAPIAPGQMAQDAILSRLNPQLQRQRSQLQSELINQGFNPQDVGYNQGMKENNQQANDLLNQAALAGISLDFQNRQRGLTEQQAQAQQALQNRNQFINEQTSSADVARQNRAQQLAELLGQTNYGLQSYNANLAGQQAAADAALKNQQQQLATLLGGTNYSLQGYNSVLDAQKAEAAANLANRGQLWNEAYQQTALNASIPAQYAQLYAGLLGQSGQAVQSPGQYGVTSAQMQYPGGTDFLGALQVANQQRAASAAQNAGLLGGLGSLIGSGAGLGALALMM